MAKINLGCGEKPIKGYVNVDSVKSTGTNVVWDLNKYPWPFKSSTFDEVYSSHFLEHVDDLAKTLSEINRISKPGAVIKARVPHFSCGVSYRDPTHKRLFSYFTMEYFTNECHYAPVKFKILRRRLNFTREALRPLNYLFNPIINLSPAIYERLFCWILPCAEVIFELRVIKK